MFVMMPLYLLYNVIIDPTYRNFNYWHFTNH